MLNIGLGEATENPKLLEKAAEEIARDHRARSRWSRKARKSIANFKLREDQAIGCIGDAARRPHVGVPRPAA